MLVIDGDATRTYRTAAIISDMVAHPANANAVYACVVLLAVLRY